MEEQNVYERKSLYNLTPNELQQLRDAFVALYKQPMHENSLISRYANYYQEIANILITQGHYQRNDLLFLPWARAYFWWFEQALRAMVPGVSLPYWDYTSVTAVEEGIPDCLSQPYYTNEDGVQAENPLYCAKYKYPLQTYREVPDTTNLLAAAALAVEPAMLKTNFVAFSTNIYPVDIFSHKYIGGSSLDTHTAAYDPIFWFTHCQLDHFWWQWQQDGERYSAPDSVLKASLKPFIVPKNETKEFLTGENVMNTLDLGYTYT